MLALFALLSSPSFASNHQKSDAGNIHVRSIGEPIVYKLTSAQSVIAPHTVVATEVVEQLQTATADECCKATCTVGVDILFVAHFEISWCCIKCAPAPKTAE